MQTIFQRGARRAHGKAIADRCFRPSDSASHSTARNPIRTDRRTYAAHIHTNTRANAKQLRQPLKILHFTTLQQFTFLFFSRACVRSVSFGIHRRAEEQHMPSLPLSHPFSVSLSPLYSPSFVWIQVISLLAASVLLDHIAAHAYTYTHSPLTKWMYVYNNH